MTDQEIEMSLRQIKRGDYVVLVTGAVFSQIEHVNIKETTKRLREAHDEFL